MFSTQERFEAGIRAGYAAPTSGCATAGEAANYVVNCIAFRYDRPRLIQNDGAVRSAVISIGIVNSARDRDYYTGTILFIKRPVKLRASSSKGCSLASGEL